MLKKNRQMNYNTNRGVNNEKVNSENKRFRLVQDTSELTPTTSIDQRRNKQNNTREQGLENNTKDLKESSFSVGSNAKVSNSTYSLNNSSLVPLQDGEIQTIDSS